MENTPAIPLVARSNESESTSVKHAGVGTEKPPHTLAAREVLPAALEGPGIHNIGRNPERLKHTKRTRFARWKRAIPAEYPLYDHDLAKPRAKRALDIYPKIDAAFVLLATVMSLIVGWIFLREGLSTHPLRLINLAIFWVVFTYVALPRIHQTLTTIYVPDYFIGRTRTADGLLGDPVNLAFEGSESDIHVAMRRAGWVLAEENTLHSAQKTITSFILGRSYAQAPVSSLFLFGRRHQFAYQQEVGGTTIKRHHIRFWRAPKGWVLPGGHRVTWLGAATYDRSVGLSRFTWQVTHKIDENTDVERDYVVDTLLFADPHIPVGVIRDYSTSYHHRNGGGDPLRTDGHLPVVDLSGARSRSTGSTAILQERHASTGISFLKGRTIKPRELVESLREGWHGAVEEIEDALWQAGDHHIPPPSIVFVGFLVFLQGLPLSVQWWSRFGTHHADTALASIASNYFLADPLTIITAVFAIQVLSFVGVIRRSRWARLVLMAMLAMDACIRIADALFVEVGHMMLVEILGLGLSSLGLLVLTSDTARMWVHTVRVAVREKRLSVEWEKNS